MANVEACAGSYDATVRSPLRPALVVLGLAAVVYGAASLTGRWLGTPGRPPFQTEPRHVNWPRDLLLFEVQDRPTESECTVSRVQHAPDEGLRAGID